MSFETIPILDLSLARSPDTKSSFLDNLRHALLEVGFLYIKNTGISPTLIEEVVEQGKAFFDLPLEKKLEIEMKNAPSFLGYSKLGMEVTRFKTDWRSKSIYPLSIPYLDPTILCTIISFRRINGLIQGRYHTSDLVMSNTSKRWAI